VNVYDKDKQESLKCSGIILTKNLYDY